MKIVEINTVHVGSTGKIMIQIANVARQHNHEVHTFSRAWLARKAIGECHHFVGCRFGNIIHRILLPICGRDDQLSYVGTCSLIKKLKKIDPDVIHLHNLHGHYINFPVLFDYIKNNKKKVVWTLHDCWAFTGHCPYFTAVKCDRWKDGCHHCPQPKAYPKMYVDTSKKMYELKKKWFSGVEDMTIITPSNWLAGLVKESFLKDYPVKVINNGIDLSIFKPTESNFRKKYDLVGKKVILGVAFDWGYRKGLDVFVELSKRLDPNTYKIVLVGTNDEVDKQLPTDIISIHRTQNQSELAEIYTTADVFAQPTREEVFGLVNAEALACGTPVVTFKTGGSPEIVDETCGSVVDCDDVDAMESEIIRVCTDNPYSESACLNRAEIFDMNKRFEEYIDLYEDSTCCTGSTL